MPAANLPCGDNSLATSTQKNDLRVIIGLGKTGLSCANYFAQQNIPFAITDSRNTPPCLAEFREKHPDIAVHLGGFPPTLLAQAKELIVSPGVSLHEPVIAECIAKGISAIGDIELFARAARAPIVGITGTNAKGTITTLVGEMAKTAGKDVRVGGNIGIPALDLLNNHEPDLYVLEISSFQLETTYSLAAAAATILNLSPDHLDRYETMREYQMAKQRIYQNCAAAIYNRDDEYTWPIELDKNSLRLTFGASNPGENEFGIRIQNQMVWLATGNELLLPTSELRIHGRHNWLNTLAALAIGTAIKLPMSAMLNTLKGFPGLPHRCQFIASKNNVDWYNDSKGTNVGATIAALESLGRVVKGKLILIAGGLGKNADFTLLQPAVKQYVRAAILIGQDAPIIQSALKDVTQCTVTNDLMAAIQKAREIAQPNDAVILSPACASFDMFRDFEHRGEVFTQAVRELLK